MNLVPQAQPTYAQFKTIVNSIGSIRAVYYFDDTGVSGNFHITVAMADGNVGIETALPGLGSAPATFAADFPNAIALPFHISVQ